ncbi:MAG: right-handed parallel beta-helix repeat-containing protein [Candidatus Methanospirareceae archaeon]
MVEKRAELWVVFMVLMVMVSLFSGIGVANNASAGPRDHNRVHVSVGELDATITSETADPSNLNLSERIDALLEAGKLPFLFFYADWCHFSETQKPILKELEKDYADTIEFIWLDVGDYRAEAHEFGVSGYPTMFLITGKGQEGYYYTRIDGYTERDGLINKIETTINSRNISDEQLLYAEIDDFLKSGKPVFLFFAAEECHFCHQQEPLIDELEQEYRERVAFLRVISEEYPQLEDDFGVSEYPTMIIITDQDGSGYRYITLSGYTMKEAVAEEVDRALGESASYITVESGSTVNVSAPKTCGGKIVCACGDTVIADYTFHADLQCGSGYSGLRIGANNLKINGNGYKLQGGGGEFTVGIDTNGYNYLTVSNLSIAGFETALFSVDSEHNTIVNNYIHGCAYGIYLTESSHYNTIYHNTIDNNNYGVMIVKSNDNHLYSNAVCDNSVTDITVLSSTKNYGDNFCDDLTAAGNSVTCSKSCSKRGCVADAHPSTVFKCGNTVTESCTLNFDLYCTANGLIIGANGITVDGNNYKLTGNNANDGLRNNGYDHSTIKDLTIKRFDYGIHLYSGANNNTIKGITVDDNDVYGVYISYSDNNQLVRLSEALPWPSPGKRIRDNHVANSGSHGVYLSMAHHTSIEHTDITANGASGIYMLESEHNELQSNSITDNINHGIHITQKSSYNNITAGNTITENGGNGIYLANYARNNLIEDADIVDNTLDGIAILNSENTTIKGNTITRNRWGVACDNAPNTKVENNTIDANSISAVRIYRSTSNIIKNNQLQSSKIGIEMVGNSSNNTIHMNQISENLHDGVYIYGSHQIVVQDNDVNNNGDSGVNIIGSFKVSVINNSVSTNHRVGLFINDSHDCLVSGTMISQHNGGIALTATTADTVIRESYVCNNTQYDIKNSGTGNTGSQNYCDLVAGWQDTGAIAGCSYRCNEFPSTDLVITDFWLENGTICYQLRNIGDAVAPTGHLTGLYLSDPATSLPSMTQQINLDLPPGKRLKRCFPTPWQCSGSAVTLYVCADCAGNVVSEKNEWNNCRAETWKCDATPPHITSGPTVSAVTQNSASISWVTTEASDSVVKFGRYAGLYEDQVSSATLTQTHVVALSALAPSTTYHYVVQSADASGNTVVSREGLFETQPVPDSEPPVLTSLNITKGAADFDYYEIEASASDNVGIERVEFYLDEILIGIDYTAPYRFDLVPGALGISREEFFMPHDIRAVAYDKVMMSPFRVLPFEPIYECEHITLEINRPYEGMPIYTDQDAVPDGTLVDIEVYAAVRERVCTMPHCHEPGCRMMCHEEIHNVSQVKFYVNNVLLHSFAHASFDHTYLYEWNASGYPLGTHVIRIDAIASEDCKQTVLCNVEVTTGEPSLDISREVSQLGNVFLVELTVRNDGGTVASAPIDKIEDTVAGFQPLRGRASQYEVTSECTLNGKQCDIEIDLFSDPNATAGIRLDPGRGITIEYEAVPVLYSDVDTREYSIGDEEVSIVYDSGTDENFDRPCILTSDGTLLADAIEDALLGSDYLIVTNPARLFRFYSDNEVDELLSSMASLAAEKNGVLGYLNTTDSETFKSLIEPDGQWSSQLTPDWTSTGYLLIVGETEIVHSRTRDNARLSDNHYADISGRGRPELIVGRIIGDSPAQLMTPIETSLLDQFDRTDAFVMSGIGGGRTSFENNADDIADLLDDEFTVDLIYGSAYSNDSQRLAAFTNNTIDKDVIVYRDHGSENCWSHTICENDGCFPLNFGTSYPFAFGLVCLAGHYEVTPNNGDDYCIGEAFLDSNVGVYIGATEESPRGVNNEAGKEFFRRWVDSDKSIGQAFKETKREIYRGDIGDLWGWNERKWVWEYNLYGDPKYGASPAADVGLATVPQSSPPVSSLTVAVPDYEVKTVDGEDYIEIPGGLSVLEEGKPLVPYYTVSRDFAKGYEVQDVTMIERSGLTTATGFNLPLVSMAPDGAEGMASGTFEEFAGSEWYPEEDYRWEIIENPDGSTTLRIAMFPFYYNPLTTDVHFYQNYSFDIAYATSPIEITHLSTDKDAYPQADKVSIDLWLSNPGEPEDVVLSAVVRAESSDSVLDGLLLRRLENVTGVASFSAVWDTTGFEPGDYLVEAELHANNGTLLDRETRWFVLGLSSGEITHFTATPENFEIGDDITIDLTFENTGTVDLTGTAVILVRNATGAEVMAFRHNVTDLIPLESVSFSDTWNTAAAAEGAYEIIGYVLYESTATDPVSASVRTTPGVFDTGASAQPYPSLAGTHNGTITPSFNLSVSKLYTYPTLGTGGHTEYAAISYANGTVLAEAHWNGYGGDWHNHTFNTAFTLYANETYNYTIRTGSYPQIIHAESKDVTGGRITCEEFVDSNGKRHEGWIPAIRLS